MALKFRLKGLAETFIDRLRCPTCGHDGGDEGDQGFLTELTRVTFDGIIVVVECLSCGHIFVPENQKQGIVNTQRLRNAVQQDSLNTGQPIYPDRKAVMLEVEKMCAERNHKVH